MSLSRNAKPTLANIRRRVRVLNETADSLEKLSRRWNPKGRYFKVQRDLIALGKEVEKVTGRALAILEPRR